MAARGSRSARGNIGARGRRASLISRKPKKVASRPAARGSRSARGNIGARGRRTSLIKTKRRIPVDFSRRKIIKVSRKTPRPVTVKASRGLTGARGRRPTRLVTGGKVGRLTGVFGGKFKKSPRVDQPRQTRSTLIPAARGNRLFVTRKSGKDSLVTRETAIKLANRGQLNRQSTQQVSNIRPRVTQTRVNELGFGGSAIQNVIGLIQQTSQRNAERKAERKAQGELPFQRQQERRNSEIDDIFGGFL